MMWGAACALGGAAMGVTLVSATEEGTENEDGYYFREFDPNCPYLALDPDRWCIDDLECSDRSTAFASGARQGLATASTFGAFASRFLVRLVDACLNQTFRMSG